MLPTHIKESNLVPDPSGRANHWHDPETDNVISMPAGWKPKQALLVNAEQLPSPSAGNKSVAIAESNGTAANAELKLSSEQKSAPEPKPISGEPKPAPENKTASPEPKTGSGRKSSAKAQAATPDNSSTPTASTASPVLHEQYAGETQESFRALMDPKNRQEMCDLAQSVGIAGFLEMDKATLVEAIIEAMELKPAIEPAAEDADQAQANEAGSEGEALTEITVELEGRGVKILDTGYFGVVAEVMEDKSIRVLLTTGSETLLSPDTKIRLMTPEESAALEEAARASREA